MPAYRPPLPTMVLVGGIPSGSAHWVWCGLPAVMDDYGFLVLIDPSNGTRHS
jgi:pimeloyl-ACP methyl ester carboxylesterase